MALYASVAHRSRGVRVVAEIEMPGHGSFAAGTPFHVQPQPTTRHASRAPTTTCQHIPIPPPLPAGTFLYRIHCFSVAVRLPLHVCSSTNQIVAHISVPVAVRLIQWRWVWCRYAAALPLLVCGCTGPHQRFYVRDVNTQRSPVCSLSLPPSCGGGGGGTNSRARGCMNC